MPRPLSTRLLARLLVAGCDSTTPEADNAPAPPPAAAFSFDADLSAQSAHLAAGPDFLNAASRVGVVSVVVGANLVIYNDGARACWGEDLGDVACESA